MQKCKRVVHQTLMKYYKKFVICKKIIQKWVSIYETCECDIGAPDIYRFLRVDGLSMGPRDKGVTKFTNLPLTLVLILDFCLIYF